MRKIQRTFWAFTHGEEIIKNLDNTMNCLYGLCKEEGKIQLYSSTSTVWISKHLIKEHNLSKPTITKSNLSLASQIVFTILVIKEKI